MFDPQHRVSSPVASGVKDPEDVRAPSNNTWQESTHLRATGYTISRHLTPSPTPPPHTDTHKDPLYSESGD